MTTINEFYTALRGVTITGVVRTYDQPPLSLNTADLPAKWVQMPRISHDGLTFQSYGGWPTLGAQLVVAIEPFGQSTGPANHEATMTIMEAVDTALCALAPHSLGKSKITWTTRLGVVEVAGTNYWASVTEVEGYG